MVDDHSAREGDQARSDDDENLGSRLGRLVASGWTRRGGSRGGEGARAARLACQSDGAASPAGLQPAVRRLGRPALVRSAAIPVAGRARGQPAGCGGQPGRREAAARGGAAAAQG